MKKQTRTSFIVAAQPVAGFGTEGWNNSFYAVDSTNWLIEEIWFL